LRGKVANSSAVKNLSASSRSVPHIVSIGRRLTQTAGRSGRPKSAQRKSGNSCTHGMPAGLPCGIPEIGEEIEGAMQHAPHEGRQSTGLSVWDQRAPLPLRSSCRDKISHDVGPEMNAVEIRLRGHRWGWRRKAWVAVTNDAMHSCHSRAGSFRLVQVQRAVVTADKVCPL
jgi:hypothetical protein